MGCGHGHELLIGGIEPRQRLPCRELHNLAIGPDRKVNEGADFRVVLMVVNPPHKGVTYTGFARKAQVSAVLLEDLPLAIKHQVTFFSDFSKTLDAPQFACCADIGF